MSSNEDLGSPLEELMRRHKSERKQLQAQILALKKSSANDKKKKKEVLVEIAKLEADLDEKHKGEEDALKKTIPLDDVEEQAECSGEDNEPVQRVSKAQKRRTKKAAFNQNRDARIKEQETENLQGPRHKEIVTITGLLQKRGLALHTITADGNCLYSAVEHQLKQYSNKYAESDYKALRKLTASHLRENASDFLPFLTNAETGDQMTDEEFDCYCNKVENTTAWGGQIELRALSNVLEHPIEVIQATGPPLIIGEEYLQKNKTLIVTFHRFMYRLGEHYNSVVTKLVDEEEGC